MYHKLTAACYTLNTVRAVCQLDIAAVPERLHGVYTLQPVLYNWLYNRLYEHSRLYNRLGELCK